MNQIFTRIIDIWKPDFLSRMMKETSSKPTWAFWFFWNSIIALILTLFATGAVVTALYDGADYLQKNYPDAAIEIRDGKLSTQGIQEPVVHEEKEGKSIFVLDTKEGKYDKSVLDGYEQGVLITGEQIFRKDRAERTEYYLKDIVKDEAFSLSQNDVQNWLKDHQTNIKMVFGMIIFILIWIFMNLIRLVLVLWWALVFWLLAKVMNVKIEFKHAYLAVMNFYIIPTVIEYALHKAGLVNIPFSTTIILGILFVLNYRYYKKYLTPAAPAVTADTNVNDQPPKVNQ